MDKMTPYTCQDCDHSEYSDYTCMLMCKLTLAPAWMSLDTDDCKPSSKSAALGSKMTTEKIILVQCGKCGYWHDNDTEENQGWVPYCDLHHGDGLAYPCSEFKPINSQQLRIKEGDK